MNLTSKYEKKTCIECSGVLDKDDDGNFVITVESKDDVTQYRVKDLLEDMCGSAVNFKSENHEE